MRNRRLQIICPAILCIVGPTAVAMDLGTNFWNLGWHRSSDCFNDVKNVTGENPWYPQFLKEIAIYNSFRFMDWDNTNGSTRRTWSSAPTASALCKHLAERPCTGTI